MGQAHLSAPSTAAITRAYEAKRRKTTDALAAPQSLLRDFFSEPFAAQFYF
jgi:hypothetical protein